MPLVQMPGADKPVMMPDNPTAEQKIQIRQMMKAGAKRATETGHGRRMGGEPHFYHDYPDLPFVDRTVIAAMDKPEEGKAYLERKYGEGSVHKDKHGLLVKVGDKKMRVNTGILAETTAQSPELALGLAGGAAGAAVGGPPGAIAGAAGGAMAGKAIKELAKEGAGLQRQSAGEVAGSIGKEGLAMAAGEGAGKALGLARKLPIRSKMFDITPESQQMTERVLKGGARPPPTSYAPSAKKLQRITILAQKLSGPNKAIDRANFGYLQDRVSSILDKAGVKNAPKDDTMARLAQSSATMPAMDFKDVGRLIQSNANYMLKGNPTMKGKTAAYLKQLSGTGMTPEQAYAHLTERGEADRLERFIKAMGENSQVVEAVRQRALRELFSGSLVRTESGEAKGALEAELNRYTKAQQKMLFPKGLDDDLRLVSKETQFLYPEIKDPAMAGFTAGAIMQRVWYNRFYAQWSYSFGRAMLQKPEMIRRIAIGLRDTKTRKATKAALKSMFYFSALEMADPGQDPDETHFEMQKTK